MVVAVARRLPRVSSRTRSACALASRSRLTSCLFLSSLWPEPDSSAAGVRTAGLLSAFREWGYEVSYAASSSPKQKYIEQLHSQGVATFECGPNREAELAAVLERVRPSVVVFDRFFTEEAFSFRVRELAPDALRVLDMQDVHSLRRGRQRVAEAGGDAAAVLAHVPPATSADLLRELAAVHRSDLTLVCSPAERRLLEGAYGVAPEKLALASFACGEAAPDGAPAAEGFGYDAAHGFEQRADFVAIGGFKHPPNVDAAVQLAREVWPRVRRALPAAQLHVYGAYPTAAVHALHAPDEGLHIAGHAPSLEVLARARALLAPLRYGAGIKGKIVDAWRYGLPVVTTNVGAEGMRSASGESDASWGGAVADCDDEFAAAAVRLASDAREWERARADGRRLLGELYDRTANHAAVREAIEAAAGGLAARRARDFTGAMLWQQTARSTEFFSRWIELKEAARD